MGLYDSLASDDIFRTIVCLAFFVPLRSMLYPRLRAQILALFGPSHWLIYIYILADSIPLSLLQP